ncbi:unnamed protein product [Protopolystoma xenopodis]|uniref:Uncharacterized protein n=1 Tax=Protopolystoma xenopodis TaxID=117903 RepID=A0A3S4ZD91_9PLAT|nr:unnamed protein product [Protopolystoma xenopodis]
MWCLRNANGLTGHVDSLYLAMQEPVLFAHSEQMHSAVVSTPQKTRAPTSSSALLPADSRASNRPKIVRMPSSPCRSACCLSSSSSSSVSSCPSPRPHSNHAIKTGSSCSSLSSTHLPSTRRTVLLHQHRRTDTPDPPGRHTAAARPASSRRHSSCNAKLRPRRHRGRHHRHATGDHDVCRRDRPERQSDGYSSETSRSGEPLRSGRARTRRQFRHTLLPDLGPTAYTSGYPAAHMPPCMFYYLPSLAQTPMLLPSQTSGQFAPLLTPQTAGLSPSFNAFGATMLPLQPMAGAYPLPSELWEMRNASIPCAFPLGNPASPSSVASVPEKSALFATSTPQTPASAVFSTCPGAVQDVFRLPQQQPVVKGHGDRRSVSQLRGEPAPRAVACGPVRVATLSRDAAAFKPANGWNGQLFTAPIHSMTLGYDAHENRKVWPTHAMS